MAIQFFATLVSSYLHKKEHFSAKLPKLSSGDSLLEIATRVHFEKNEHYEFPPLEQSRFSLKATFSPIANFLTLRNIQKSPVTLNQIYIEKFSASFKELYSRLKKEDSCLSK